MTAFSPSVSASFSAICTSSQPYSSNSSTSIQPDSADGSHDAGVREAEAGAEAEDERPYLARPLCTSAGVRCGNSWRISATPTVCAPRPRAMCSAKKAKKRPA